MTRAALEGPLQRCLDEGVDDGRIPFASAAITDAGGTIWEGAAGRFDDDRAALTDSVYVLLSMTKAIGAAAALVLVDRGHVDLEVPVVDVIPEFREIQVLDNFGATGPILRPPRELVRLRHLLTHTSGLTYATYHAKQRAWELLTGAPTFGPTIESFKYPLMFEPGTEFMYGLGPDWVGVLVERVSGRSLDEFCTTEVLRPLDMRDTVFEPDDLEDRIAPVTQRTTDKSLEVTEFRPPRLPNIYSLGGARSVRHPTTPSSSG